MTILLPPHRGLKVKGLVVMEVLTVEEQRVSSLFSPSSTISDNERQIVTSPWQSRVHARDPLPGKKRQSMGWKLRFGERCLLRWRSARLSVLPEAFQ
jgi:hypothetical protein